MGDLDDQMELDGDLTLNRVEDVVSPLLNRIAASSRALIDLRFVRAIDGAGLQFLIAARHFALMQGVEWRVVGWSQVLAEVLDDLRCSDLLDGSDEQFQIGKWGHLISGPVPSSTKGNVPEGCQVSNECWHLSIRFGVGAFTHGSDPMSVLGRIRARSDIMRVKLVHSRVPPLSNLSPRDCHLGLEVDVRCRKAPDFVCGHGVYVFGILPPFAPVYRYRDLLHSVPEDPRRTALDLWDMGSISCQELGTLFPALLTVRESGQEDARRRRVFTESAVRRFAS